MLPLFHHWPLQRKLTAIMMATSSTILLLASIAYVALDILTFRDTLVSQVSTLAEVVGTNSTAALTFHDHTAAADTLSALEREPHIVSASTFDKDGRLFASFDRRAGAGHDQLLRQSLLREQEQYRFGQNSLDLVKPIILDNERVGWVHIQSDLSELHEHIRSTLTIALVFLGIAGLLAYALSSLLQRTISSPILALAQTMQQVTDRKDYTIRTSLPARQDELGTLLAGFDGMLNQIQTQNDIILHSRQQLERDVAARTAELSRALSSLQDHEQFLTAIIDNLPITVFVKEAHDLRFVRLNKAAEDLFGIGRTEMLGKSDCDFFPKEDANRVTADDRALLADGQLRDIPEDPLHTKHLGLRLLHTKKIPIRDESGKPRYLLGISEDITERKQAEEALREQMRLSSLAAEINSALVQSATLPAMLQQCTAALIRHLDAALVRIWLLGPGDLCGACHKAYACSTRTECLHLTASAGLSENLDGEYRRVPLGALKIGKIAQGWGTMTTNDVVHDDRLPNKQWLTEQQLQAFAGYPLTIGTRVVGVLALFSRQTLSPATLETLTRVAQVISLGVERMHTETALRASEERLALTVQGANIGIWDWNLNTNTVYFSPLWKQQLGYDDQEIVDAFSEWESRVHPDDLPDTLRSLRSYIDGTATRFDLEFRLRHKDGSYRWILSRGALIRDAYSVASRMIGIHIDTTNDKLAAEELHRAKAAAEAASLAKSEFLANMSHEVRTPMNGVLGMTELLLETNLSSQQRHLADTAHRAGTALLSVLNDILDFSKIEAGKLSLETIAFSLRPLIEEVGELFANAAQRKRLELACFVEEHVPPFLQGDPARLRQVLVNLVGNAIKFTEQGEVFLHVQAIDVTSTGCLLRCEVRDTGIGLSPAARSRIFQPFTQADSSTTRQYGGTGLGLAIVSQLVQMMGGTVGVESEEGHGATFWFTARFPLARTAPAASPATTDGCRGKRMLIVDDHPTNRTILEHYLQSCGAGYESAASGRQALDLLRTAAREGRPYDIAILDLQMPDMDGLELAQAIKADVEIRDVRLILLTSVGLQGTDAATNVGILDTLCKPVKQSQLYQCLLRALSLPSQKDEPGLARALPPPPAAHRQERHILVAEDNAVNQDVVHEMLALSGYTVTQARTGREAVELSAQTSYDAILMDCQMPEMDGFTAAAAIRAREASSQPLRRVPIIALTAHAMQGDRNRCLAAGMDDYLSKPFTRRQMDDILRRWLNRTDAASQQGEARPNSPDMTAPTGVVNYAAWEPIRQLQRPGHPDPLKKVLARYLENSPALIEQLRQAIQANDPEALCALAHHLKSSSAILGAVTIAEGCKELETLGRNGRLTEAAERFQRMEQDFTSVCAIFQTTIKKDTSHDA